MCQLPFVFKKKFVAASWCKHIDTVWRLLHEVSGIRAEKYALWTDISFLCLIKAATRKFKRVVDFGAPCGQKQYEHRFDLASVGICSEISETKMQHI